VCDLGTEGGVEGLTRDFEVNFHVEGRMLVMARFTN
jgi:hypothetical protein